MRTFGEDAVQGALGRSAAEAGGRVAMNQDEKLVGDWLAGQGHAVRHLGNGEDPPDIVVDGCVAVEVTTIASYAFRSVWDFVNSICRSLGPAENGRGYYIWVESDDQALLQGEDRRTVAAIKRDLKDETEIVLSNHYARPDAQQESGRIRLPHGVEVGVIAQISDNRDNVKYRVGSGGSTGGTLVVSDLISGIQSAIRRKTNNRIIEERAGRYEEWWLVVTDPHYATPLNSDELQTVTHNIKHGAFWQRILLANIAGGRIGRVIDLSKRGRNAGESDAA